MESSTGKQRRRLCELTQDILCAEVRRTRLVSPRPMIRLCLTVTLVCATLGCDVKAPDDPAIFNAARNGDMAAIRAYQARGGKLDIQNYFGHTMIYPALEGRHFDIADYLLSQKVPLWLTDRNGLRMSEFFCQKQDGDTLMWFVSRGLTPGFYDRLHENELFHVARAGTRANAILLLKSGFDPSARNYRGQTPEDVAIESGNVEVARALSGWHSRTHK